MVALASGVELWWIIQRLVFEPQPMKKDSKFNITAKISFPNNVFLDPVTIFKTESLPLILTWTCQVILVLLS